MRIISPLARWLVVLIGCAITAAAVIHRLDLGDTKQKAYNAAMRSDLRRLAFAESVYFSRHATFTDVLSDLPAFGQSFQISVGVALRIDQADAQTLRAVATHSQITQTCALAVSAPHGAPDSLERLNAGCSRDWHYRR